MISDKHLASEVSDRVLEVNRLLNETAALVQACGTNEEAAAFRLAIGHVLGELLLGIVNPLYRRHPELKPADLFVPFAPLAEKAQLNDDPRQILVECLNTLCGEANEAARLATVVFSSAEMAHVFRREAARIMEIVENQLLPKIPG